MKKNPIKPDLNKSTCTSLDEIKELSIMRLGDRPTKNSKNDKVQKYGSLFENNQFQID